MMPNSMLLLGLLLISLSAITTAAPANSQQQQSNQQTENLDQLIEETKHVATQAGTASNTIYTYIETELLRGKQLSLGSPCFIRERTAADLEPSPRTNYVQQILEDYQSAVNYMDYIQRVEERYNETMNGHPSCDYSTRFRDIKQKTKQLLTKLTSLVEVVNSTSSSPQAQQGDDISQDQSGNHEGMPEYCSNLCPEQQVMIFKNLYVFASVYIQQDLSGLLEQLKTL